MPVYLVIKRAEQSSKAGFWGQLMRRLPRVSVLTSYRPAIKSTYDDVVKEQEPMPQLDGTSLSWALSFEVGLGVIALIGGRWAQVGPLEKLLWPPPIAALGLGMLSALPPLAMMLVLRRLPWTLFRELTEFVDHRITPMFRGMGLKELAILSLAAGWGEELLFRGLIQSEIAQASNPWVGICLASLVFALLHLLSPTYFVIAFFISCYFGWLFWMLDSLWIPILAHAVYDFLMLVYMLRIDAEKVSTG